MSACLEKVFEHPEVLQVIRSLFGPVLVELALSKTDLAASMTGL
jgi:hypothetical protein